MEECGNWDGGSCKTFLCRIWLESQLCGMELLRERLGLKVGSHNVKNLESVDKLSSENSTAKFGMPEFRFGMRKN